MLGCDRALGKSRDGLVSLFDVVRSFGGDDVIDIPATRETRGKLA
jgi:hypothetical protein